MILFGIVIFKMPRFREECLISNIIKRSLRVIAIAVDSISESKQRMVCCSNL